MKTLLTIFISVFILSSASANSFEGIKIATNKQSAVELRLTSNKIENATITITNEAGITVGTQVATIVKGNNNVTLVDINKLAEGTYTVTIVSNNNTVTTKFINWK